mgnify:CR=1 FL=1
MKSEAFIRMLLSELSNQVPFDLQDSTAMLEQLPSLRNIENQIAFAGGMIGKRVEGQSALNDAVDGVVTAVRVQEDKAILWSSIQDRRSQSTG